MKKIKLATTLLGATLLFSISATFWAGTALAESNNDETTHHHERTPLLTLTGLDSVTNNDLIEIEDGGYQNGIAPRWGFQWQCTTSDCGYTSAWHGTYGSASKYALAHHQKYGHSVVVFGV